MYRLFFPCGPLAQGSDSTETGRCCALQESGRGPLLMVIAYRVPCCLPLLQRGVCASALRYARILPVYGTYAVQAA